MPNIIEITDFSAPELDVYARYSEVQLLNRHEPEKGIFIAESPKVIGRALDAGCVPISLLLERKHVEGQGKEIISRCGEIPVYTAEFDVLTKLTGFKLTRGMLCAMYRPGLPGVGEVCRGARRIAVLENVMNPTNIGAIFRSAAALNMDAVLLTPACSNPLYRRAIRVSMGTVFQVPWTFFEGTEWPQPGMELLRSLGFKTAAMALSDGGGQAGPDSGNGGRRAGGRDHRGLRLHGPDPHVPRRGLVKCGGRQRRRLLAAGPLPYLAASASPSGLPPYLAASAIAFWAAVLPSRQLRRLLGRRLTWLPSSASYPARPLAAGTGRWRSPARWRPGSGSPERWLRPRLCRK